MIYSNFKRALLLLFTLSVLFFSACSNNANQYLLEDVSLSDSEVTISLLTIEIDELYGQFPDHEFGALRPAERRLFNEQLSQLFASNTISRVTGKLSTSALLEHPFQERTFQVRNRSLTMIAPEAGTTIQNGSDETRFVVVLDKFYFTPYQVQVGGDTYAGHEGDIERRLRFETKYLIWDNEKRDAIAWGMVEANEALSQTNQNETYRLLVLDAFRKIIQHSPFSPRA